MLATCTAKAQYIFTDSVKVGDWDQVSVDRLGNIYLADIVGNIDKYSSTGKKLERFSPTKKGKVAVLEAWNPLRIFVYYAGLQEYVFLDRFLVNANRFNFRELSNFVGMSTVSLDNNIWFIDYVDFSLKKLNTSFGQVEISRPFDLVLDPENYEITHMREYQNLLFISDSKSGVLIFDNLGNHLKTIKDIGIQYFGFNGDELYYVLNHQLFIQNIYTSNKSIIKIQPDVSAAIIFKEFQIFLTKKWLKFAQKQ